MKKLCKFRYNREKKSEAGIMTEPINGWHYD